MTNESDDRLTRRRLLETGGAGIAALTAGCLGGDQGENSSNQTERDKTETETNSSENSPSTPDKSETTDQPDDAMLEDEESQPEKETQAGFSETGKEWIETPYDRLVVPQSAIEDSEIRLEDDVEDPFTYQELIEGLGRRINQWQEDVQYGDKEINSVIFAFSDETSERFAESYREAQGVLMYDDSSELFPLMGSNETPFEQGAIERFLQENVEGVSDYSEEVEEELLEYAES